MHYDDGRKWELHFQSIMQSKGQSCFQACKGYGNVMRNGSMEVESIVLKWRSRSIGGMI